MKSVERVLKLLVLSAVAVLVATGCAGAKKKTPEAMPSEAPTTAEVGGAPTPAPPAPSAPADDVYTVVAGDCLWCISARSEIYGDPYQWPVIYRANRDQITDADLIYPGQDLTIQRSVSASLQAAAVEHAKTRGAWALGVVEDSDRAFLSANP